MRITSSVLSIRSLPVIFAIVDERSGSAVTRKLMVTESLLTPREVAPPLSPLKRTHGGE